MKKTALYILSLAALCSCNAWLKEDGPMVNRVEFFFTSAETATNTVNAAYTPLAWDLGTTYYGEWFIGDIASDDALKGGQNVPDGPAAYDIDNFKTIANNEILREYYRGHWQGIARANLAIEQVPAMELDDNLTETLRDRLTAEARFLRAYYYFRLTRVFGDVPMVTAPIYSADGWIVPRSSVETIYKEVIIPDLEYAEAHLPAKSAYPADDMGRITSGAAQAMLLKTELYFADLYVREGGVASEHFANAVRWGKKFIADQASEYSLCADYSDNFTLEGENGPESVFEIQHMAEGMSDYGGNGFTRGCLTTIEMRGRSAAFGATGWGFNRPTQSLYDEYESGDPRRDATIIVQKDEEITNPEEDIYLGNRYLTIKRTMWDPVTRTYPALDHPSRSGINNIQIRLADVWLMYAEACLESGDRATAKEYLEKVRARARGTAAILPEFPYGSYSDTDADLRSALRHERRVELAMEGHRWFDLTRWGVAYEVMTAYKASESEEVRAQMADFIKGTHELFPIPSEEIMIGELTQNNGYN